MRRFLITGAYSLESLDAARAFAKSMYPEEKRISTIVDESDTRDIHSQGTINPEIIAALNYVNPYLRSHRSKYTFINFCASKFRGTILSRMYTGSWLQELPLQSFSFGYQKHSLAELMRVYIRPSIFIGSSVAVNILIKSLSSSSQSKRFSQKFPKALLSNCKKLSQDHLLIYSR